MAKQLNKYEVQLEFRADTSQAKKELQQFQNSLTQLTTKGLGQYSFGKDITNELSKATVVTKQLQENLYTAFNVDTGKLDLGKFHESMTKAGYELKDYKNALMRFGPEGEQAFNQLARSITEAEIPLRRSNALLTEFWTTLKNTARWQISSSLLHGFMGTIKQAYSYAQNLNESLNNIRIVTGYNVDKMAEFAANANKAAQALSTTTTAYTDAALIYYQQGLGDEEVLGRTDVTVKMANVSRQSAEEVSDQLTAIWNNFYDGSKSLEYYADVITALGAATASSSEEISTGLEKFAAVADTVGLSYEYATAALATITATTRQSAETVGTGLRTLFARLEGLKLGETLEDGVDYNKYSAALKSIGVDILNVNGEIKDMDTILEETAAGWDTLSKAQQVAFAQTVGGVRQYTNLIALMDNWDFMQSNLGVAADAEGTLQKQADIYADSWEAAQKRVKAAMEDIYGALLDDKFFIELNNILADALKTVKNFITAIGGLKGVLTTLGAIALTVFQKNIGQGLNNLAYNVSMMTSAGQARMRDVQKDAIAQTARSMSSMGTAQATTYSNVSYEEQNVKQTLIDQSEKLGVIQKELYQQQIQSLDEEKKKTIELAKQVDLLQDQADEQALDIDDEELKALAPGRIQAIGHFEQQSGEIEQWVRGLEEGLVSFDRRKDTEARGHLYRILCGEDGKGLDLVKKAIPEFENDLNKLETFLQGKNNITGNEATGILSDLFLGGKQGDYDFRAQIDELANEYANKEIGIRRDDWDESQHQAWMTTYTEKREQLNAYADTLVNLGAKHKEEQDAEKSYVQSMQSMQKAITNSININRSVADSIAQVTGNLMSVASAINIIHGLKDLWSNEDVSTGQKIVQTISSVSMALMMLTRIRVADTVANLANIGAAMGGIPLKKAMITLNTLEAAAAKGDAKAKEELAAAQEAVNVATMEGIAAFAAIAIAIAAVIALVYALAKAFIIETHEVENAEQATTTLKESYDRLKTSAQEFKDSISDYSEGIKALDDLTEGTKEYNEALEKSNEKAKELIEKYKLFNDYEYDGDRIVIHQEAIDNIQKRLDEEAAQARVGMLQSQLYTNELKQKNNIEDIIRQSGGRDNFKTWNKQYQEGKYSSAEEFLAQSTDKGLNEKIANSIADYNKNLEALNDEQQYLLKELAIAHFSTDKFSASLDEVAGENDKLRAAMINAQASLVNFDIDEEQLKEVTGVTGKSTLESYIRDNYAGNEDVIKSILGGDLSTVKLNDENIAKILASQMSGLDISDLDYSKGKNGKITVKDLNGNAILDELNPEFIAQNLAKIIAQEITSTLPDTLNEALLTATENVKDLPFGEELAIAFNESVSNGELNFDSLFSQITQQQHDSMTADELSQILFKGMTIDEINQIIEQLGYENVDEYNKALAQKWAEYTQDSYNDGADDRGNQKAKDFGLDEDAFKIYREHLRDQYDELRDNAEAANEVAIANMRLEKGVKSIASKWDDYNEVLSNSSAQFEDVARVEGEMKEALTDMLDIDASTFELLPPDFAQKNWQLITDAVNGVEGAIDELRNKAGEEILFKTKAYMEGDEETRAKIDYLNKYIEDQDLNSEIKVGVTIEDGDFFDACQNIINEANMTAQEAQAYFASMGYDVELEEITNESPVTSSYQYRPLDLKATAQAGGVPQFGPVEDFDITNITRSKGVALKSITPNGSYGGGTGVKRKSSGGGGKKSGGGGGGKTAAAENQKITSKDDAGIKRYKEIDDALQDIAEDQERINKLTDTYYGANKVKAMKQRAEMLKQEADLYKKKYEWAKKYQDEDLANLQSFAADHGMSLDFQQEYDAVTGGTRSGSLTNYTAIMENLYSQLNEKETYWAKASNFGSKEAQDEYKKKYIDPIAETIKEFDKLVGIYDDSRKTLDEEANDYLDRIIEAQEATYAAYKEDWDLKLEILEDQRKFLDHSKKLLGDSAVELGEAMALIGTKEGEGYLANTLGNITELARQEKELESIREQIGEDNYYNRLKEIRDGYLENTEALKELDNEMMEYYGKVMDKVNQEVEKYIKNMETLKKTLQSYQKVLKVTGRETDYDAMDDLLRGEASVIQAQYDTKAEQYELYQREVAKAEAALKEAEKSHDEKAIEIQKKRLETAKTNLQEVGNEMLDILAEKAENAKAIMDNMRAKIMASYEDAMTNGLGFDYLDATMERYSTIQDLYLTKTNQVFETTKMLRKIQSDMDSTSNRAAKERLNNFSKEIESLKDREKMTKADLELAQKKYDLLLAEIALEEAQKAKTTVRLQRDNEGNYGYVYTADEGNIAQAEDDMLKAENDLYNTRLRIANESGEAIYQINEEWMNAINELVEEYENDRNMSEEEFNKKKEEINKYYLGLMAAHSHNFTEAQKEDARVVADAWINNHDHDLPTVMEVTERFGEVSTKTLDRVDVALDEFKQVIDDVVDEQEDRFGDSVDITHDVETAAKDLAKEIRDDLRHEYKQLFDRVGTMIDQYSKERSYILNSVIPAYTDQAKAIQEVINKRKELATVQDQPQQKYDGTGGGNGSATVGAGTGNGGSGGGGNGGNNNPNYIPDNNLGKQEVKKVEQKPAQDTTLQAYLSTLNSNPSGLSDAGITYIVNKLGASSTAGQKALAIRSKRDEYNHLVSLGDNLVKNKTKYQRFQTLAAEKAAGKFNTGGYTGEWSDGSGKLAVLHSKELVLNAKDTENMLAVVDMVRQITNSIDLNAAGAMGGYGSISSGSVNAGSQTLEQNVQITASFPNATNHSEIEEAFNNLINKASQYANRR